MISSLQVNSRELIHQQILLSGLSSGLSVNPQSSPTVLCAYFNLGDSLKHKFSVMGRIWDSQ